MAFKPTQRLYSRGAGARVKGFRAPSINMLRRHVAETNDRELSGILRQDFGIRRSQPSNNAALAQKTNLGPGTARLPKETLLALQRSRYGVNTLRPSSRNSALDWNPPPYHSRDSVRWKHVVYSFNKNKTQAMPLLTSQVRTLAQSYLNMEERAEPKEKGKNPNLPPFGADGRQKAWVSGYTSLDQPVMQDLLGKLSENQKSFMIPYRELLKMEEPLIFRHRGNSVNISMHVHDERLSPPPPPKTDGRSGPGRRA